MVAHQHSGRTPQGHGNSHLHHEMLSNSYTHSAMCENGKRFTMENTQKHYGHSNARGLRVLPVVSGHASPGSVSRSNLRTFLGCGRGSRKAAGKEAEGALQAPRPSGPWGQST